MPAYKRSKYIRLVKAAVTAGDWTAFGNLILKAQTDTDADGYATFELPVESIIENLTVKGQNAGGNAAVAVGDIVYRDGADFNVDGTNGKKFGVALGAVTSGNTTTAIDVLLIMP